MTIAHEDKWIERYAELLGCEPRPGAIAAAIENLKAERDSVIASIPGRCDQAMDRVILNMRGAAVNCGSRPSCAVAYWFKTSNELKSQEKPAG